MKFTYASSIGQRAASTAANQFRAVDPALGEAFGEAFHCATEDDVHAACVLATEAAPWLAAATGDQKARLLRAIAIQIEARVPLFVEYATRETGLPEARIRGETARTCGQLRHFADTVADGSWVDARIDHGDALRSPLPKPDVRSLAIAIGPVVVFGASNFPLAFSTAGVDTVSALAAGCPVIVKAHPAHPHTSEIAAQAILQAVRDCGFPDGTFSHLLDHTVTVGSALVSHAAVKAVGFTGSLRGGRALFDLAAARPEPIPVYAEMGSSNPQFVLPNALAARATGLGEGLAASVLNGMGQFCTRPGLVFVVRGPGLEEFRGALLAKLQQQTAAPMLSHSIADGFYKGWSQQAQNSRARCWLQPTFKGCQTTAGLLEYDIADFQQDHALADEVFGPSTVLVVLDNPGQFTGLAQGLAGQLASSLHLDAGDEVLAQSLITVLQHKAGRVQINGFPTGVEVCHAMVHGGPYPACTDSRSSSIGSAAINRFARRVAYQGFPDALLPPVLQEHNPVQVLRLVDGEYRR